MGLVDNIKYNSEDDYYICKNNKKLYASNTKIRKSKTGYKSKITYYTCDDCSYCEFKRSYIKGNNSKISLEQRTKRLEISKLFHEKRKDNLERITSIQRCKLRMNRSIQVEGALAQIKHNINFKRSLSRGNSKCSFRIYTCGVSP
ncbi:transposase [Clostridioides sp. ZZV14-6345]|uniref:transposase n=1 Tax=Clostridioides sp. ZZV14-6345 TaxID=2811496 RepID=UPI001D36AB0C|nr:transposase [Clostridioides sp. ZZV14-6345]